MKPVVSAMQAWSCFVISVFAIVILSVLGFLFRGNHPELVGGEEDPADGPAVAATVFTAVIIYATGVWRGSGVLVQSNGCIAFSPSAHMPGIATVFRVTSIRRWWGEDLVWSSLWPSGGWVVLPKTTRGNQQQNNN
ncbi:predicted protein [Chaetomium globosum CBS 148.51]|uniref:Uncharacterized protein n=1 Tax=Chaetomium globosum (strain ATCC 6205 / CBS 148.51 / DSM 1962 / NBRC 6347 / NRRL 1970) TaxID=306901 RepID=Q2HFR9_CHAGB|nr:uncharacterized protein CHGG_00935 [Chaetomium globosum CBS 148.51]EAQ92700.1 predicted protein [Chaetomium globosum CBS 148.51]